MRTSIAALVAGLAMSSAGAKDYRVSEIQAIGERCNFHNEPSTQPCSDFKPPAKVAMGESFSAEGLRRVIRLFHDASLSSSVCLRLLACAVTHRRVDRRSS
jgi:hypothetical protein